MSQARISLEEDQVLQKFLARRIAYEREMKLVLLSGEEIEGFVTGFDDSGWIQLSLVDKNSDGVEESYDVLVQGLSVATIEETGRGLKDTSLTIQVRIRDYSYALKKSCERAIRAAKKTSRAIYTEETG